MADDGVNGHIITVDSVTARGAWSLEHPDDCPPDKRPCQTQQILESPMSRNPSGGLNLSGPGRWRLITTTCDAAGLFALFVEAADGDI